MTNTRTFSTVTAAGALAVAAILSGCSSSGSNDVSPPPSAAVASLTATAAGSSSAAPSTDTHMATQDVTLKTGDGDGEGMVTVTKPALTKTSDPSVHGQLYRVQVTVKATSGTFQVVPGYFTAQNSSGDTYQASVVEFGQDLEDTSVTAGRQVRGYLSYDVPAGQSINSLTLVDGFNQPAGTWDS